MTSTGLQRARRGVLVILAAAALASAALAATGPSALHASAATAPSTPGFAVSEAIDSSSGNTYIAAQGPGHSLYFYWNLQGTWYGPLAVGAPGSTYSAPSLTIDSNGNVVIAAQGPSSTLWFYWNVQGTWHGPLQVGAPGSAVSTPSIALDQDGHLDLAVQGPSQTLSFWWDINGTWNGPAGLGAPGKTLSAPSISADSSGPHLLWVATEGPNHSLIVYQNSGGTWATPAQSNAQTTFAAPSNSYGNFYVQGAGQDMDNWFYSGTTPPQVMGDYPIGPGDLTLSAPAGVEDQDAVAIGPSNSLYFYWRPDGWAGPLGIGASGSSFSNPAIASKTTSGSNPAVAVEGPSNSLYFYWDISGTWHGPVAVGGAGTTFSSAS